MCLLHYSRASWFDKMKEGIEWKHLFAHVVFNYWQAKKWDFWYAITIAGGLLWRSAPFWKLQGVSLIPSYFIFGIFHKQLIGQRSETSHFEARKSQNFDVCISYFLHFFLSVQIAFEVKIGFSYFIVAFSSISNERL